MMSFLCCRLIILLFGLWEKDDLPDISTLVHAPHCICYLRRKTRKNQMYKNGTGSILHFLNDSLEWLNYSIATTNLHNMRLVSSLAY